MNVADLLTNQYKVIPDNLALKVPTRQFSSYTYTQYTFRELEERSAQYANAFKAKGITLGMKVILFVKPSFDFPAITFALFRIGAVPVMIDPGMGVKNLLKCVKQVNAKAMIGIGSTHILRRVYASYFKSIDIFFTTSRFSIFTHSLPKISDKMSVVSIPLDLEADTSAAVLFTSGGTGVPKGVLYTHGIFTAQTHMLQQMFGLTTSDVDCPGFPLFALFTIGMGMCAVVPDMNPSRPALADPEKLVSNINDTGVTFAAGSPAIWEKVADFCIDNNIKLETVKYLVMFGAPVRNEIHEKFQKILPNGDTYTPYGATECLPIASISGREILVSFKDKIDNGAGVCVGKAAPGVTINIIKIHDEAMDELTEKDLVQSGEVGEILIDSPTVTPGYFEMPEKTKLAKITVDGRIFHRMGDVGYLDAEQNLWFCGRKDHLVQTQAHRYFSIPTEAIFNTHPKVKRCALVKVNRSAALVIERIDHQTHKDLKLISELKELSLGVESSQDIKDFYFHSDFPVDVRHNIKIDRKKLWIYAQNEANK
jgi:olefin beta-lactone synthetase